MSTHPPIVTTIPIERLWTDAGPLWTRRGRYLSPEKLREELAATPATVRHLAIAEPGKPLAWIAGYRYWMGCPQWHYLASLADADNGRFPGPYCFVASEWPLPQGTGNRDPELVILLERYDRHSCDLPRDRKADQSAIAAAVPENELAAVDQNFYLDLYRYALGQYQPILEQRAGVALGRVQVKPLSELSTDMTRSLGPFLLPGVAGDVLAALRGKRFAASVGHWNAWSLGVYWHKSIYVSFTFGVDGQEDAIIRLVVHELAHRLWERLGGQIDSDRRRLPSWRARHLLAVEGHATYIELAWLLDAYPPSLRKRISRERLDPASIYTRGFRVVKSTVDRLGPAVLNRLPRKWNKLIDFAPDRP